MINVVPIVPCMNVAKRLRDLADEIERSDRSDVRVSCVVDGKDIYCWGPVSDTRAAEGAVFDFTFALHKIMGLPVHHSLNEDGHI